MDEKNKKPESQMEKELSPELYKIAREKGTEPPFSGKYWNKTGKGTYNCAVCGNALFSGDAQFVTNAAGLKGWPSFDQALPGSVRFEKDDSLGMARTEVVCNNCGSHLGHVFDDDQETKTGKHYCINSTCLMLDEN